MRFETKFNCGDMAWVFDYENKGAMQVTVGQIRVEYTKSKGLKNGHVSPDCPGISFDNYKPRAEEYHEVYMCVETGIGTGTLWELGKSIFATEAECLAANAARIEEIKKADRERAEEERRWLLAEQARAKAKLERLERQLAA